MATLDDHSTAISVGYANIVAINAGQIFGGIEATLILNLVTYDMEC